MKTAATTILGLLFVALCSPRVLAQCETPNMMIVLDRSGSMGSTCNPPNTKWADAVSAVSYILTNYGSALRFGLDLFPSGGACEAGIINVDVAPNTAAQILNVLNANPPLADCQGKTPMAATLMALNQYRALKDIQRRNFVMLVSDGDDTCSSNPGSDPVTATADLYTNGIKTFVIGFGTGANPAVLNAIATAGHTGTYHQANDQAGLRQAMDQIISSALVEICDDRDNDCDGLTDETWGNKGTLCKATQGLCEADGVYVCNATRDGTVCNAQIQPRPEVCDGLDNDCNGVIDNGFPDLDTDGSNQCSDCCDTGSEPIQGCSVATAASINPGAVEKCNGHDDDCDSAVDESDPQLENPCGSCTTGESPPCYTDLGECQPGTFLCLDGVLTCIGEVNPTQESCDGWDNDCDGQTDEGFPPVESICDDSLDNDCDGLTDAWDPDCGANCQPGQQESCGISLGDCEMGVRTCDQSGQWGPCEGGVGPSPEVCDGRDNDCNGLTDEGFPQVEDICDDGVDNDCDGLIDRMDPDCGECKPPEQRFCGRDVGECRLGIQTCTPQARWGECAGEVKPENENCDGLDNDCDGITDEGHLCSGYEVCLCGTCAPPCSAGECPAGTMQCVFNWCVYDLCCGVSCPPGEECNENGRCANRCEVEQIVCQPGQECRMGECILIDCFTAGNECQGGQRCVAGVCENDPCAGVACGGSEYCREGVCESVACPDCRQDQICEAGQCVDSLCAGLRCELGQICIGGECATDPCQGIYCPVGATCTDGSCVADPCINLHCPVDSQCLDGYCVATEPKPQDGGTDAGPDAGEDAGPDAGPGDQLPADEEGQDAGADTSQEADQDGKGTEEGCGCLVGEGWSKFSDQTLLMLLPVFLVYLRKKCQ